MASLQAGPSQTFMFNQPKSRLPRSGGDKTVEQDRLKSKRT